MHGINTSSTSVVKKSEVMKKKIAVFLLISSMVIQGQSRYNQFSLEASYGYSGAISPYMSAYKSNFSGLTNLNIGGRYMFNEYFGLRGEYANDRFENDPGGKIGIYYNRIGLQAYFNAGKLFGLPYILNENIGLLTHGGVGYTRARPIDASKSEQIGNLIIGITPQLKLSERVAIFTDVSFISNFKQHYRFDGSLISEQYKPTIGFHYNISLGLMVYLGNKSYHADWY